MNNINDVIDLSMQTLLCQQLQVDELDVWNNMVIATVQECTECYYGHMLLQDVIVEEFTLDEIKQWLCEELGYEPWSFTAMLDAYYEEEPMPDPVHDTDIEWDDRDSDYDRFMAEELSWYNWARMMGYE